MFLFYSRSFSIPLSLPPSLSLSLSPSLYLSLLPSPSTSPSTSPSPSISLFLSLSLSHSQLLLFALSEPLSGSAVNTNFPPLPSSLPPSPHLNTTVRADLACQVDARRVGLHGRYVAMLSAHRRTLYNVVPSHYTSLPVVNTKVLTNLMGTWLPVYRYTVDPMIRKSDKQDTFSCLPTLNSTRPHCFGVHIRAMFEVLQ